MVITHAQVDAVNRFLALTAARERSCRLVQYFSRFFVFYLLRNGASKDTIARWNSLKGQLGNARKFFRLLKPIEFAQAGVKSFSTRDEILRLGGVVKQFGMFLYFCSEAMSLSTSINFYRFGDVKKLNEFGLKCWFVALAASFLSGLYKFKQLAVRSHLLEKNRKALQGEKDGDRVIELKSEEKNLTKDKYATKYQLVQDALDIVIPTAGLGWLPFDEGVVGIAGMITSLMGMHTQWKKANPM